MTTRDRHDGIVAAMREIVSPFGVTVEYGWGGKHAYAILTHPDGRWMKEPIAGSPRSTDNQVDWGRQAARRALTRWGLTPPEKPRTPHQRHARIGGGMPRRPLPCETRLSRDPWAVLRDREDDPPPLTEPS